jgi:hypothetical protein
MQDEHETTTNTVSANPAWPITDREAATRLHLGLRRTRKIAVEHGIGRRAGKRLIFSRRDFDALYNALPSANECGGRALVPTAVHPPRQAAVSRRFQALIEAAESNFLRSRRRIEAQYDARGKRILKLPKPTA